jgi:prevent-host-death family protein
MKKTNLHEAKTNLSKLVELVLQGEEVIICKAGKPVAKLVSISKKKKIRKPGALKGKITIKEDFDQLPDEFMEYFR